MLIVACPHCQNPVLIEELNCRIFRHGVFIESGKQIDPHAERVMCEKLINEKLIYGCGKPFKIIEKEKGEKKETEFEAVICEYI